MRQSTNGNWITGSIGQHDQGTSGGPGLAAAKRSCNTDSDKFRGGLLQYHSHAGMSNRNAEAVLVIIITPARKEGYKGMLDGWKKEERATSALRFGR